MVGQGSASIKLEPKSQACLRSLNLAVVFIDAILVLSHFVKTQNLSSVDVTINIKILLLPCPSKDQSMFFCNESINSKDFSVESFGLNFKICIKV